MVCKDFLCITGDQWKPLHITLFDIMEIKMLMLAFHAEFYPAFSAIQRGEKTTAIISSTASVVIVVFKFVCCIFISFHHILIQIILCQNQRSGLGITITLRAHTTEMKKVNAILVSDKEEMSHEEVESALACECSGRSQELWK